MRALYIGDWHQTVAELDEGYALGQYVIDIARAEKITKVVLLGDQHHNHSLVHVRVQDFWLGLVDAWRELIGLEVVMLKGNHDEDAGTDSHALRAHTLQQNVTVVDKPTSKDGVLYLPYIADEVSFLKACHSDASAQLLVCHQAFQGCRYENGAYMPHGFDLSKVPQRRVVSGHIHAPQQFDKVWYPGAPRWRSASDANTDRFLYVVDEQEAAAGRGWYESKYPTNKVCSEIRHVVVTPDQPATLPDDVHLLIHRFLVDIKGPRAFCMNQKAALRGKNIRVRTFPTDTATISVKESEGIGTSFGKYLSSFSSPFGTNRELLQKMAQERLGV